MPTPKPLKPAAAAHRSLAPLLMRRSAWVALAVLVMSALLGLVRMQRDIEDELDGARALAGVMAQLAQLDTLDDAQARDRLRSLQAAQGLRHLTLRVQDGMGLDLLGTAPAAEDVRHEQPPAAGGAAPVSYQWTLRRPGDQAWHVTLRVSERAERSEALRNLVSALALLGVGAVALLMVMRWNLRHAFQPLDTLLAAIARVEEEDHSRLRDLPPMPISELERLAAALRHLAASLAEAQERRRLLSRKMLTLQEDERAHLARELHDEMGQQLSSLRADAAWLARKLPADDAMREVVLNLDRQCEDLQVDVRQLLVRLRPMGAGADAADGEPASRLRELLQPLVQGWRSRPSPGAAIDLEFKLGQGDVQLPRALVLAVYRLSQEALTNVSRHAQARQCRLRLSLEPDGCLVWEAQDDGIGIADPAAALLRGNGLAGMQERTLALGGEFSICHAQPGTQQGLVLRAVFDRQAIGASESGLESDAEAARGPRGVEGGMHQGAVAVDVGGEGTRHEAP